MFQFRYDGLNGKFIREIKDNAQVDNATKDPNFLNGFITTPGEPVVYEETKPKEDTHKTENDEVKEEKVTEVS